MQTVFETNTHKVEIATGATLGEDPTTREREWRDAELLRTDILSLLPDRPNKPALMTYRTSLRDYPSQGDFPNGARPS